jgi:hypothetical protein
MRAWLHPFDWRVFVGPKKKTSVVPFRIQFFLLRPKEDWKRKQKCRLLYIPERRHRYSRVLALNALYDLSDELVIENKYYSPAARVSSRRETGKEASIAVQVMSLPLSPSRAGQNVGQRQY